jgi:hypothetical protein
MKMFEMHAWSPFSLLRSRISMHVCGHSGQWQPVGASGYTWAIFTGYLKPLSFVRWTISCPGAQGIA